MYAIRSYYGGSALHAVCVLDGDGQVVDRFEAAHTREGLGEMLRRLARRGEAAELLAKEREAFGDPVQASAAG